MFSLRFLAFALLASCISYAADLPEKEICAAALETLMHTKKFERYVKSEQESGRTIHIFASRTKAGDLDACYIDGNRVIWRVEKSTGIKKGRWRTHSMDEKVLFQVQGDNVDIILDYGDGSKTKNNYSLLKIKNGIR